MHSLFTSNDYGGMPNKNLALHDGPILRTVCAVKQLGKKFKNAILISLRGPDCPGRFIIIVSRRQDRDIIETGIATVYRFCTGLEDYLVDDFGPRPAIMICAPAGLRLCLVPNNF